MIKYFNNKRIIRFLGLSFSLLFLMVVGVLQVKAAVDDPCLVGDKPGDCQESCSTGYYALAGDQEEINDQCADPSVTAWKCCALAQCTKDGQTGFCRVADDCPAGEQKLPFGATELAVCIAGAETGTVNPYTACCVKTGQTYCSGTIEGKQEPSGICQKTCDTKNIITEPTAAVKCATDQKCCKPDTGSTTISENCEKAGGACSATACDTATQQEVSANQLTTPCADTAKFCCKVKDATATDQTPTTTPATQSAGAPPDEVGAFAKAIGWLISILIWLGGSLLLAVVELIVKVSQFNKIINSYFVVQGWIVLRDLVNMFFVLGLLFIAFVTVLKIERYQWQKLLPKLLIMAVVVNFSRTICGLMIDFFQVMMFTFVNAYKDIAGENLYKGLGLRDMWDANKAEAESVGAVQYSSSVFILGRLLGLIYVIVALIVCLIFLVILVFRVVVLWILVVFSPLAFFSAAFTGISAKIGGYWSQWFKMFIEYCMVGPLLAFFLWLSILSIGSDYTTDYAQKMSPATSQGQGSINNAVSANKAGRLDYIMKFVLGILMLVAGLKFTADMKVMGSNLAGKAATKLQAATVGRAERLATWGANLPGAAIGLGGKYAGMTVKEGLGRVERAGGASGWMAKQARLFGTKEGHKMLGERMEARIQAHAGGQKVALQEQRQKEQDRYAKEFKRMGVAENPEMMQKELARATGDRKQALMDILGDEGKMTSKIYNQALKNGDFKHLGIKLDANGEIDFKNTSSGALAALEKKSKKWEKAYQDRTHLPIAFSPMTRNEITNAWEPTGSGTEGKKKRLKDVEDALAKEGSANLGLAINNGDFANTGDLATDLAHLAAVGRNSNFKTVGEDAQKKVAKLIGEKLAALKVDTSGAKDHFDLDRMKNVQKAHEVGTGQWEPGSGRGTIGITNSDLAGYIRDKQQRPVHDDAKAQDAALVAKADQQMPGLLKTFQSLREADQIAAIQQHMKTVTGKDVSSVITPEFISEAIKFRPEIMAESSVKSELAGAITSAFNAAVALARKGGSADQVNKAVATLESTIAAARHSVKSAGMSEDYFEFNKLDGYARKMKTMGATQDKLKQQGIITDLAEEAQIDGYFNGGMPKFKDKGGKKGGSSGGSSGGGGGPAPAPAPTPAPAPAPAQAPAPSVSTTINIVNNTAQSITSTAQQILSAANDPIALQQALTQTLRPLLDRNMADLQKNLGNRFDASVRDSVNKKVDALIAASGGSDIAASRKKIEAELPKIIDEIKKIEKTKAS